MSFSFLMYRGTYPTSDRHPLQELAVPSYVANSALLLGGAGNDALASSGDLSSSARSGAQRADGPSTLLLTGPNYSGKSVYQKQVSQCRIFDELHHLTSHRSHSLSTWLTLEGATLSSDLARP